MRAVRTKNTGITFLWNSHQFSSILCDFPNDFSSLFKIHWLFPDWKLGLSDFFQIFQTRLYYSTLGNLFRPRSLHLQYLCYHWCNVKRWSSDGDVKCEQSVTFADFLSFFPSPFKFPFGRLDSPSRPVAPPWDVQVYILGFVSSFFLAFLLTEFLYDVIISKRLRYRHTLSEKWNNWALSNIFLQYFTPDASFCSGGEVSVRETPHMVTCSWYTSYCECILV